VKDTPEKISGTSTCKGLFDLSGTCVPESQVKTALEEAYWGIKGFKD